MQAINAAITHLFLMTASHALPGHLSLPGHPPPSILFALKQASL
jgi:hypothetical protein